MNKRNSILAVAAIIFGTGTATWATDVDTTTPVAKDTLALDYDLYWKGFKVMEGLMTLRRDGDGRLSSSMRFETKGILDWFEDGLIRVTSEARIDDNGVSPLRYQAFTQWNKDNYVRHVAYNPGEAAPDVRVHMPADMFEREEVPLEHQNAVDPASLVMLSMTDPWGLSRNPETAVTITSFDGLRAFSHTARCLAEREDFETSRKVPYEGDVIVCEIEGRQTHGFRTADEDDKRRNKDIGDEANQEDRTQSIEMYLSWSEEFGLYIPVRIAAKSEGGRVVAYLKDANVSLAAPR